MNAEQAMAVQVFGEKAHEIGLREAARQSERRYVRSQDHLAPWNPRATGRVLSAWEALSCFGIEALAEVDDYGSAVLPQGPREPALSLRKMRKSLGLSPQDVARKALVQTHEVQDAEDPDTITPIRVLECVARILGLDEGRLGRRKPSNDEKHLATRLRSVGIGPKRFNAKLVTDFSESAWVITKQAELGEWLGRPSRIATLRGPSADYGGYYKPPWKAGFELAQQTRMDLGLKPHESIPRLRELTESLGIPVLQTSFARNIAGATLATRGYRGIVVNSEGMNANVWVRRATIAHELGHLIWDPEEFLQGVVVDSYNRLATAPWSIDSKVEARANAFAIELLAPQTGVVEVFQDCGGGNHGLRAVMEHYGVSMTAARFHVWNGLNRSFDISSIRADSSDHTADWAGRESFTVDYFPQELEDVPVSRRGGFAGAVLDALRAGLIDEDSAGSFLCLEVSTLRSNRVWLDELFPPHQ